MERRPFIAVAHICVGALDEKQLDNVGVVFPERAIEKSITGSIARVYVDARSKQPQNLPHSGSHGFNGGLDHCLRLCGGRRLCEHLCICGSLHHAVVSNCALCHASEQGEGFGIGDQIGWSISGYVRWCATRPSHDQLLHTVCVTAKTSKMEWSMFFAILRFKIRTRVYQFYHAVGTAIKAGSVERS